ncbi:hypothetical protein PSPO01_13749 [Paraphaeosphaeria sporulosa]
MSTTCGQSMTKLILPPTAPVHESLDGGMSIQTINLPISEAPQMLPGDSNDGADLSTSTITGTRENDLIAGSYMDPQDLRPSILTEEFGKPAKRL